MTKPELRLQNLTWVAKATQAIIKGEYHGIITRWMLGRSVV